MLGRSATLSHGGVPLRSGAQRRLAVSKRPARPRLAVLPCSWCRQKIGTSTGRHKGTLTHLPAGRKDCRLCLLPAFAKRRPARRTLTTSPTRTRPPARAPRLAVLSSRLLEAYSAVRRLLAGGEQAVVHPRTLSPWKSSNDDLVGVGAVGSVERRRKGEYAHSINTMLLLHRIGLIAFCIRRRRHRSDESSDSLPYE